MLALLKAGQSVRLKVRLAGFFQIIKLKEKTIAVKRRVSNIPNDVEFEAYSC